MIILKFTGEILYPAFIGFLIKIKKVGMIVKFVFTISQFFASEDLWFLTLFIFEP